MLLNRRLSTSSVAYLKYLLCLITVTVTSGQYIEPTRYDLIHYLLSEQRYDHSLPPDFYNANVTNVSVELSITDLDSESDIDMELEFTLYMRLNWTDNRLNFTDNRTSYDSLTLGDDIVDRLWIPDLFFHHERKAELHGFFTKNQLAYIYKNGSVLYSGRFSVKSHCAMDLTYYPYDTQTCSIVIQSYAFTKDELLLYWNGDNAVNVKVNTVNLKFGKTVLLHSFDSPYDHPVGNYSTLTANITFNRTADSFEIMYIAPPVVLVIISLTSFLLADSISSRIIVSTGASTQLIMQWAGIYNKLPPVSDLTYIDGWMLGNLVFIGYNIIINAAIYHFVILKEKEEKEEMKEQKTKKENIKMESKIDKRNDNVLEDNHLEMQASGHTTQRNQSTSRQQSEGQIVKNIDETSPLVINEQSTYDTIEKEGIKENNTSVDDMDGRSRHNLGYNHGEGQEHEMTSSSDNQGNESQNSTNQVIDKIRNIWKRLKDLIFFLHDYFKKKKDFREFLEDYEEITTSTKWEDAKEILKEDPRFERARKSNMASTWYKTYIDKKKKKEFKCLLKEEVKNIKKWKRAEKKIDHDPRFAVADATGREKWFKEYRRNQKIRTYINVIGLVAIGIPYFLFVLFFLVKMGA